MKLYHGTTERHLESILKGGIKPRGKKKDSTWRVPSHPEMTYFSVAYALYYALNAIENNEKCLIVEVETRKMRVDLLHPDEDFIAQAIVNQTGQSLNKVHKMVVENIHTYQERWEESLEKLGNCSFHKKVLPTAITRYCLFDPTKRPLIRMAATDPSISIPNFFFCGQKYINLTQWLFDDKKDLGLNELEGLASKVEGSASLAFQKMCEESKTTWDNESQDRTGIQIMETAYEGSTNQERLIQTIANRLIKGMEKKAIVPKEAEDAIIDKYERYIVKAIPYINQNMQGSSASFGAVLVKAMIKYGIDKGSKFGEAVREQIFSGVNDPAYLLYNMQAKGKKKDAIEWYKVNVTAARAHCEGRQLAKDIKRAATDIFTWNDRWEPVIKGIKNELN